MAPSSDPFALELVGRSGFFDGSGLAPGELGRILGYGAIDYEEWPNVGIGMESYVPLPLTQHVVPAPDYDSDDLYEYTRQAEAG